MKEVFFIYNRSFNYIRGGSLYNFKMEEIMITQPCNKYISDSSCEL